MARQLLVIASLLLLVGCSNQQTAVPPPQQGSGTSSQAVSSNSEIEALKRRIDVLEQQNKEKGQKDPQATQAKIYHAKSSIAQPKEPAQLTLPKSDPLQQCLYDNEAKVNNERYSLCDQMHADALNAYNNCMKSSNTTYCDLHLVDAHGLSDCTPTGIYKVQLDSFTNNIIDECYRKFPIEP